MRPLIAPMIAGASAFAANLFVATYSGSVDSISLSQTLDQKTELSKIATVKSATPQPTWQERLGDLLFVANENISGPNGSIISYKIGENDQLTQYQEPVATPFGPVATKLYNDGKALAVAHYGGHAVSNYVIGDDGKLSPLQTFVYQTPPGPRVQQDNSHPHQVVLHPSGDFFVVPDLGSDLLRIFSINSTHHFTEQAPISVTAGWGPRHGAFLQANDNIPKTYFFLITELSNTVASYAVTTENDSLAFKLISASDALNMPAPDGAASAEIIISPDGKFLLTTVRNANILTIPNPSPGKDNKIPSDTIQSWAIDTNTGMLTFKQSAPAGGRIPRHLSFNKDGTLIAVGSQADGRVVIYSRNVETGDLGDVYAAIDLDGEVEHILWDEK